MAIEDVFYQIISNVTDIQDAVGGRIYFEHNANQDETDYLVYSKSGHQRSLTIERTVDINVASFQVTMYSPSEATTRDVRDKLVKALHGTESNDYGTNIQLISVDSDSSGYNVDPPLYQANLFISLTY